VDALGSSHGNLADFLLRQYVLSRIIVLFRFITVSMAALARNVGFTELSAPLNETLSEICIISRGGELQTREQFLAAGNSSMPDLLPSESY
jgi:hypothetical protein